ncbi:MAG: sulfatase [Halorhabdus sp.]
MAEGPNLVLVSIDSLRADHCGFLGDDRGLTPTIDAIADAGVAFETAVATGPQTFSSMPAVVTGRRRPTGPLDAYPGESHWERRLAAIDDHLGRYATLAERLRELGYTTAGFSPNPWASTASGFDRGFDHFTDLVGTTSDGRLRTVVRRLPGIDESSKPVELALDLLTGRSFFTRWQGYYDAIDAVRRDLPEPYFLWVFLMDTHYPFLPSRTHRQEQSLPGMVASTIRSEQIMRGKGDGLTARARDSMRRSYRDTVRSVDAFVRRLQSDLAGDDPAVLLHSDHGESFGEHGNYGHHHRQLYEENVHVPFAVDDGTQTARVGDPVSLSSIPDVALSIARTGTFDPSTVTTPSAVATSECGTNRAVRTRRFKYLEHGDNRALFDLARDGVEDSDVTETYPEVAADSRSRLDTAYGHVTETNALSDAARTVAGELP